MSAAESLATDPGGKKKALQLSGKTVLKQTLLTSHSTTVLLGPYSYTAESQEIYKSHHTGAIIREPPSHPSCCYLPKASRQVRKSSHSTHTDCLHFADWHCTPAGHERLSQHLRKRETSTFKAGWLSVGYYNPEALACNPSQHNLQFTSLTERSICRNIPLGAPA